MTHLDNEVFWQAASSAFSNHELELILLPTEQCNFRCTYCYERFELGHMSDAVVESIKKLIQRRVPELRKLSIEWFGGEPLLALDVIEQIGQFAQQMTVESPYLEYKSSITTNGLLLTPESARRLERVGVHTIHVSLDGPSDVHDKTRKLRGGQGSFARINKNLKDIRKSDINTSILLRVHVTQANIELLDTFTDDLIYKFLSDSRFSIYFFPIVDLGGPNQGAFSILNAAEATATVNRLTKRVQQARGGGSTNSATGCASPYVCYAAKPNAWVIRSDGQLSKCTVAFDDERNHVGQLLPNGLIEVSNERLQVWMRGWTNADQMSLHCPYEGLREDVRRGLVVARG